MLKYLLLLTIMLLLQGCLFLEKDEILPSARPYTGNQLRMNGYYYRISSHNNVISHPLVLYTNGISLFTYSGSGDTLGEMDEYIRKHYVEENRYSTRKYNWGVFFIDSNQTICMHFLYQDYPHREYVYEGVILNDSTFHITKSSNDIRNDIYHFREFYPKPDSTNKYIK